jgi:FkbM family methyltransferase
MLSTRTKVSIARKMFFAINLARRAVGSGPEAIVTRDEVRWRLDLREGIDLALYLGVYERSTTRALRRLVRPGAIVLDIGANIGAHTLPLARLVGPAGRVHAFEPTVFAHAKLLANLALNPELAARVSLHQVMLTDGGPVAPEVYSSWPLTTKEHIHEGHQGRLESTSGARALRLDDHLAEIGVSRVDFVKLDVDGYECDVLGGATRTLAESKPIIIFELAPYVLAEHGHTIEKLLGQIVGAGYRLEDETTARPLPHEPHAVEALIESGGGMNVVARPVS